MFIFSIIFYPFFPTRNPNTLKGDLKYLSVLVSHSAKVIMDNIEPPFSGNIHAETEVKKEEKKKMKKESVSLMGLFSAADNVDYFLMFLGGLGTCIHGGTLPLFFVFFGGMLDSLGKLSTDPNAISSRVSQVSSETDILSLGFWT